MEKKVLAFIKENNILTDASRIVLGVSGGADSMALAHFMLNHFPAYHYIIAHVHHGLRAEADEEARFVEAFAAEQRVEFRCHYADILSLAEERRQGVEETGRIERYRFFRSLGADRILTAHHRDDDAETVLLHILRGCGIHGLSGISPRSDDLGRPFLCVTKKELLDYCAGHGIAFQTDLSNEDTTYTRNRIRREVLPLLREINPRVEEALCRLAHGAAGDEDYLRRMAAEYYGKAASVDDGRCRVAVLPELCREPALARRVIRMALEEWGVTADFEHTEAIRSLGNGKGMPVARGIWCYRERDHYLFGRRREKGSSPESVTLPSRGTLETAAYRITVQPTKERKAGDVAVWGIFDAALLDKGAVLRCRRPGDYVVLPDGKKKKLSDYFIDKKVAAAQRDTMPLLAVEARVLWVIGDRFFASPGENNRLVNVIVKS